ncbi:hypothetical protein AMTRI_Chr09g33920 [Amborella trichopoda]
MTTVGGLGPYDVNPRLVYHYGIPEGSETLALDSIQNILAISTKDGRIKLVGVDQAQVLLESTEGAPSKFLQFLENQGILLNVTTKNQIEVWDIDKKELSFMYTFEEEITSFTVIQGSHFMYIGNSLGNISVMKFDRESCQLIHMQYTIPLSASRGSMSETSEDTSVAYILPQPLAETRRTLVIFGSSRIIVWDTMESKVIAVNGSSSLQSCHESNKRVTSACWACPVGTKVVVGYSSGEICLWSIPPSSTQTFAPSGNKNERLNNQILPLSKLNLGYKMDKVPIVSLKWVPGDERGSCLYVNGVTGCGTSSSFQIIILKESNDSRTIKLELPLPEHCVDMEILSNSTGRNKHLEDALLILLKSGHLLVYDESDIKRYLFQSQSKSPPPIPKQVKVKLPLSDSSITVAKFISDNSVFSSSLVEGPAYKLPPFLPLGTKSKDGRSLNCSNFGGFTKIKKLYITGHINGDVNFWDASYPLFQMILSIKLQSEEENNSGGIPITALEFDIDSRVLVTGDQVGTVHIFSFKPDQFIEKAKGNPLFIRVNSKSGYDHVMESVKVIKAHKRSILSICLNCSSRRLVVGCDEGYVSLIDMEGPTLLSQKCFSSESSTSILALQMRKYDLCGSQKEVLFVALEDASIFALDSDTGGVLSVNGIRPSKPTRAVYMSILGRHDASNKESHPSSNPGLHQEHSVQDTKSEASLLLLCSEKSVRLYSIAHIIQGVKKVYLKEKLHGTCCWASTFCSNSIVGLMLLFTSGKMEIRSLPDLSLQKMTSIRGFPFCDSRRKSNAKSSLCSSSEGEVVLVTGDQEIFFFSVLPKTHAYSLLGSFNEVYKKNFSPPQEHIFVNIPQKEKKKGLVNSIIQEIKGSKARKSQDSEDIEALVSCEQQDLAVIFSTCNFPPVSGDGERLAANGDYGDLDIDDIEIEDHDENTLSQNDSTSNKHKLSSKFHAIKGKLKPKKTKDANQVPKEEHEESKPLGTVDQIKKRYGYAVSNDSSAPKLAQSKLVENLQKVQGINTRTAEMQNDARSFSAMANQVLKIAEYGRRSS